jgi:hypothetical protein
MTDTRESRLYYTYDTLQLRCRSFRKHVELVKAKEHGLAMNIQVQLPETEHVKTYVPFCTTPISLCSESASDLSDHLTLTA